MPSEYLGNDASIRLIPDIRLANIKIDSFVSQSGSVRQFGYPWQWERAMAFAKRSVPQPMVYKV